MKMVKMFELLKTKMRNLLKLILDSGSSQNLFSRKELTITLLKLLECLKVNLNLSFIGKYQSLRVFQKIQAREIHPENIIVELSEKARIDIMCGSKVKMM